MFSNADIDVVDISSSWRQPKAKQEHSTQTPAILKVSQECSSARSTAVACQTADGAETAAEMGEDTDPRATLDFLRRVEPEVSTVLRQNLLTHAFDGCSVSWGVSSDKKTEPVFTLSHRPPADAEADIPVTALTWSATGSVVAAGYGRLDHVDMCWHKSFLSTWNVDRHASRAVSPDRSVVVESCVMSLAFHPERAVLLTGGVYNGNVHVWDLGREDEPRVASTILLQFGHTDPVNAIEWIEAPGKSRLKQYNILSLGGEGRVVIWELDLAKKSLVPMFHSTLVTSCIPKSMRVSKGKALDRVGISCAGLSREDSKVFLVGAESGNVFKCSLHSVVLRKRSLTEVALEENIVTLAFAPHVGPVYAVSSSPFHRNMFLSCSTDATLSVFSMLDTDPLLRVDTDSLRYLLCAEWSPFRPAVFVCGSGSGEALVYDLSHSRVVPVERLLSNSKEIPVYAVKFNGKRRQLLATGDGAGTVVVWELSSELCNQKPNELRVLERIANRTRDIQY